MSKRQKFWTGVSKALFSKSIKSIEHQLENDPEIVEKTEKVKKLLEEIETMADDYEEKYG
jgi:hypothetical protein